MHKVGSDPMSPEALRKKIEEELGGNWERSNPHQIDLKQCLLQRPIQKVYENSLHRPDLPDDPDNTRLLLLWLVLKEDPIDDGKYAIVYNERAKIFGLAVGKTLIAFYGSFIDTLAAMQHPGISFMTQ
jgi:hypothetical protein